MLTPAKRRANKNYYLRHRAILIKKQKDRNNRNKGREVYNREYYYKNREILLIKKKFYYARKSDEILRRQKIAYDKKKRDAAKANSIPADYNAMLDAIRRDKAEQLHYGNHTIINVAKDIKVYHVVI